MRLMSRHIDIDPRGTPEDVVARLSDEVQANAGEVATGTAKRGRGRPKLGVVSKEVTLLPRHWAWLGAQPGSVSATLRRLVDEASFEEAIRALYRGDEARFSSATEEWPPDLREHSRRLAEEAFRVPVPSPHTSASEPI